MTGNVFLWQDISSCDKKFLHLTKNFFQWKNFFFTVTENFVQWRERISFNRKFLLFFLWQGISSCDRKFIPVTRHFFLWQKISSCDSRFLKKYLAINIFPGQDISGIFYSSDIKPWQKWVIFGYISKSQQKCMIFGQNFAWGFKASFQDSWHLGR